MTQDDDVSLDNPMYPEDVFFDPWHWLAILNSGEQVSEYDPETGEHQSFAAVCKRGVAKLVLAPQYPQRYPGLRAHVVLIPQGARPIMFRSRSVSAQFDPNTPLPEPEPRITGAGWQRTTRGRNSQILLALYDDGSLILTDDRGALP